MTARLNWFIYKLFFLVKLSDCLNFKKIMPFKVVYFKCYWGVSLFCPWDSKVFENKIIECVCNYLKKIFFHWISLISPSSITADARCVTCICLWNHPNWTWRFFMEMYQLPTGILWYLCFGNSSEVSLSMFYLPCVSYFCMFHHFSK